MSVASEAGKYNNFSGKIKYNGTDCEVVNATFELLNNKKRFKREKTIWIIFDGGMTIKGNMGCCLIKHCIFQGNIITSSVFYDGTFAGKRFSNSYWYGGEWICGDWIKSKDKFNRYRVFLPSKWNSAIRQKKNGVANEVGIYNDFSGGIRWNKNNIEVLNAEFELNNKKTEYDDEFVFHSGIVVTGEVQDITVNNGEVQDIIWHNGEWYNGIWNDGCWSSGDWFNGTWISGYDRNGDYHGENNPPSEWNA